MDRRRSVPEWVLFAVPLCALALGRGVWAPDEPRYAEIAREAFESGELLVLHLNGEPYPDKPPLVFWLAGALGAAFGWSELALRLPSIAATLGSAWLTARLARRWLGEEEARWAPLFLLGSALPLWVGSRLQIDAVLAFFVLAAVERMACAGGLRELRAHAAWGGLFAGLGGLAKGPVAWLHVALALGAFALAPRAARFAPRRGKLAWFLFGALAIAPVALWALLVSVREPAFARALFFDQHLGRVSGEAPHAGPAWEHLALLAAGLLPATLLVAAGCRLAWRGWGAARDGDGREAAAVRIALWFAAALAVFSAIPPKRDLYLLPVYPAAALLAARVFAQGLRRGSLPAWIARGTPAILALAALALLVGPWWAKGARAFAPGCALTALPLAFIAWRACAARDVARWARLQWLGLAAAIVVARLVLVPAVDGFKCARGLAEAIAALPEQPSSVLFLGVKPEGYRFYAGIEGVKIAGARAADILRSELGRGGSFHLVARRRELERLPADLQRRFEERLRRQVGSREVIVLWPARADSAVSSAAG